jgi:hypothetical protein
MAGDRQARDLPEQLSICNRPREASQRRIFRRCPYVHLGHERGLTCTPPHLILVVPSAATLRLAAQGDRVRAAATSRISGLTYTDASKRRTNIGEVTPSPAGRRANDPRFGSVSNTVASASSCRCGFPKTLSTPKAFRQAFFKVGRKPLMMRILSVDAIIAVSGPIIFCLNGVIRRFGSEQAPGRCVRRGRELCKPSMNRMNGRHGRPQLDHEDPQLARR